jgi:hypothetical protein
MSGVHSKKNLLCNPLCVVTENLVLILTKTKPFRKKYPHCNLEARERQKRLTDDADMARLWGIIAYRVVRSVTLKHLVSGYIQYYTGRTVLPGFTFSDSGLERNFASITSYIWFITKIKQACVKQRA